MRFYVPEWDDRVDADYDFIHDEHSSFDTSERNTAYIWDIFEYETTPIDGVLVSREQVGNPGSKKYDRLTDHGVYADPELNLPEWVPTISDCGAWGYKSLPFPPYSNREMLEFYEAMDVTTGVTIDHLVLGTGHTRRLYLNGRALGEDLNRSELPESLVEEVDVMVDRWPTEWPSYVRKFEPSICGPEPVEPFSRADFEGPTEEVLDRLDGDQRAVLRADDTRFRYDLTLSNAEEMFDIYETEDYSFRLMAAIQGWGPDSYVKAAESVLNMGYQYLGIGGVAGSSVEDVRLVVTALGNVIEEHEQAHSDRIETHVFGFAKTGAFDAIGRNGVASFDSASMLRSAWTGPENYHLDDERRFDALRVRYPRPGDDLKTKIKWSLRGQEVLLALRAFDESRSIAVALEEWHRGANMAIEELPAFLQTHRRDERFHACLQRDAIGTFRGAYDHEPMLKASFGGPFRRELVKLLREDTPNDPIPWTDYLKVVDLARSCLEEHPTHLDGLRQAERTSEHVGTFDQVWPLIESYTELVEDEEYLDGYRELLSERPWEKCPCPICNEHGIEVAIFRGNNRNRRRGFHNMRRFYDQFEEALPKVLVVAVPTAQLTRADTVGSYLKNKHDVLWSEVHDLPVAEIGVLSAEGVHEWWEPTPAKLSLDPEEAAESLADHCVRYREVNVYDPSGWADDAFVDAVEASGCCVHVHDDPAMLRTAVDGELALPAQSQLSNY